MAEVNDVVARLEALEKLSGDVAHDLNNLLAVIVGNAELLSEVLPPGSELMKFLEPIQTAGERSSALVERLLVHLRANR